MKTQQHFTLTVEITVERHDPITHLSRSFLAGAIADDIKAAIPAGFDIENGLGDLIDWRTARVVVRRDRNDSMAR